VFEGHGESIACAAWVEFTFFSHASTVSACVCDATSVCDQLTSTSSTTWTNCGGGHACGRGMRVAARGSVRGTHAGLEEAPVLGLVGQDGLHGLDHDLVEALQGGWRVGVGEVVGLRGRYERDPPPRPPIIERRACR